MFTVEWAEKAEDDLKRMRDWIAKDNPGAAERVRDTLRAAPDILAEFPLIGTKVRGNLRQLVNSKYPYLLRYLVIEEDEVVLITRVLHFRRQRSQTRG